MVYQMTCEFCKHFLDNGCHRYPPQVTTVVLPGPPNLAGQQQLMIKHLVNFPRVEDDCSCGEWEAGNKPRLTVA